MSSTVIFTELPKKTGRKWLVLVSPRDLLFRIFSSFVPPFTSKYCKIYVDIVGPLVAVYLLNLFIIYGYCYKLLQLPTRPVLTMMLFEVGMPSFSYLLAKLGRSKINFFETVCLIGYSLYGHILTLLVSFIFFDEASHIAFFLSLIVFGGASSLRLILVFLKTIPTPAARLLICSSIALVNILFIVYLHFGLMRKTYLSDGLKS